MHTNDKSTAQKVAIITGAGTGIGAATAKMLARQHWRVVLGGRTPATLEKIASEITDSGGTAHWVQADVTQSSDVKKLVAAAGSRLDALIHSAGIGHCLTIDELDETEWLDTLNAAATGAFLSAKYALPLMRKTRGCDGFITQICSLASGGTWELEVGYGTAKGAQLKFALHLQSQMQKEAAEGGRQIHVHAVCPGTVDTPFWDRIPQRQADPALSLSAQDVAWVVEQLYRQADNNAESLTTIKPREDIIIERHKPFEAWDNVIAIKHTSHP